MAKKWRLVGHTFASSEKDFIRRSKKFIGRSKKTRKVKKDPAFGRGLFGWTLWIKR